MAQAYRSFRSALADLIGAIHARAQARRLDRQQADCECYRGPWLDN